MKYHTRKWVKPSDLNPNHSLFGGRLLEWIDEEAALYAIMQLDNPRVVTKSMSEINFVSSARQGDIIEIGIEVVKFGHTSLTLRCKVRNTMTCHTIITIDKITMVALDENGHPTRHGKTEESDTSDKCTIDLG
jgi:acyl-coA hydrolase family protein